MKEQFTPVKNILLVDDDEDEQLIIKLVLDSIGLDYKLNYSNGFFPLKGQSEFQVPDLAFIDINMPREDGFAWVKKIRDADYEFPIVMFSNSKSQQNIDTAYQLGANLYLQKPGGFDQFKTVLQSVLALDWRQPETIRKQHFTNGRYSMYS